MVTEKVQKPKKYTKNGRFLASVSRFLQYTKFHQIPFTRFAVITFPHKKENPGRMNQLIEFGKV